MFVTDRLNLSTQREYTDEGFLVVPARISRTGIQDYFAGEMGLTDKDPLEIIKVFRPEEEVFAEASLKSFANKPITDNHPPELVTSKNVKEFSVGHAGPEVVKDGDFAKTKLFVVDAEAIAKVESGKVELSNGYTADIEWSPGITPDGEQYDAIQKNIKGNHIAIVERGRAGRACRVADNKPKIGGGATMAKVTIDGVDYEVSEQAAQAVSKLQGRVNDAEESAKEEAKKAKKKEDEMEEEKKKASETKDSLQAKLDDALSKHLDSVAIDKLVSERSTFVKLVDAIAPGIKWEGKSNADIKKEVVAQKCPGVQLDEKSEAYIDARFDMLTESIKGAGNSVGDALRKQVQDAATEDEEQVPADVKARAQMVIDNRNAWKGKGGAK